MDIIKGAYKFILKQIYDLLILRILVLEKNDEGYLNRPTFATCTIPTSHGEFVFEFKQDRRAKNRKTRFFFKTYICLVTVPEDSNEILKELNNIVTLVVIIFFFKVNLKVLAQVLLDNALDEYIKIIEHKTAKLR